MTEAGIQIAYLRTVDDADYEREAWKVIRGAVVDRFLDIGTGFHHWLFADGSAMKQGHRDDDVFIEISKAEWDKAEENCVGMEPLPNWEVKHLRHPQIVHCPDCRKDHHSDFICQHGLCGVCKPCNDHTLARLKEMAADDAEDE